MKCLSTLDVKTNGSLRVKRCTVVFNNKRSNPSPNEEVGQEEQVLSNHITVQKVNDSDYEIKLMETPGTLEDKGRASHS